MFKIRNSKIAVGILLIASLSGCLGFFENNKKQAAEETVTSSRQSGPPSFDDGSLYLKALAEKDAKICSQLKDTKLKERCGKEIAK